MRNFLFPLFNFFLGACDWDGLRSRHMIKLSEYSVLQPHTLRLQPLPNSPLQRPQCESVCITYHFLQSCCKSTNSHAVRYPKQTHLLRDVLPYSESRVSHPRYTVWSVRNKINCISIVVIRGVASESQTGWVPKLTHVAEGKSDHFHRHLLNRHPLLLHFLGQEDPFLPKPQAPFSFLEYSRREMSSNISTNVLHTSW